MRPHDQLSSSPPHRRIRIPHECRSLGESLDRTIQTQSESFIIASAQDDASRVLATSPRDEFRAMGRRDKPIAQTSPWQNGFAKRLIGYLRAYARSYDDIRTHPSLDKDAPAFRPIQRTRIINSHAFLGGLHHYYVWVQVYVLEYWLSSRSDLDAIATAGRSWCSNTDAFFCFSQTEVVAWKR